MYELVFYEDANGDSPVAELIAGLDSSNSKDATVQLKKLTFCFDLLEQMGTRAPKKHVEHIQGDLWQIRTGRNRILFFFWNENRFVLLHPFLKQTQRTPKREIEQAVREMSDWKSRYGC